MNAVPYKPAVLLETSNIIVINKPHSINFHSINGDSSLGIARMLTNYMSTTDPSIQKLYPVHRIDTITSGALIFAKNLDTARKLGQEFTAGRVNKYYIALSSRKPSKKQGSIIGDMVRARRGSWMLQRTTKSRPAITRFISTSIKDPCFTTGASPLRAFLLKPDTGRSHQLRVAMKSIGAPVLGDARYSNIQNDTRALESLGLSPLIDRGYLHACALRFRLKDEQIQVVCRPDDGYYFTELQGFREIMDGLWFPKGKESDYGTWFAENTLLRSSFTDDEIK